MSRIPEKFEPDKEKMRQLIQYISQSCASQENYGKTKLCKTLYFADSLCFLHTGKPITGWNYIKMPHGPYPDGIEDELDSMIDSGLLQIQVARGDHLHRIQKPVNLADPNLDVFSPQEIDIVSQVIQQLENLSGSYLSEISHLGAWKFAEQGHVIPYESFHLDTHALSETEKIRGMEVAVEHGLLALDYQMEYRL